MNRSVEILSLSTLRSSICSEHRCCQKKKIRFQGCDGAESLMEIRLASRQHRWRFNNLATIRNVVTAGTTDEQVRAHLRRRSAAVALDAMVVQSSDGVRPTASATVFRAVSMMRLLSVIA
jgi:hypothetical protein